MNQYYPSLLSPLKIGGKVLKNRMGMSNAAPTFVKGSDNLYPLESLVTYMRDMARNGAAIVTCPCPNWRSARSRPIKLDPKMMVPVFNEIDKHQHFPIPGEEKGFDLEIQNVRIMFSRIAEAIHGEGSLASISCMEIEPLGWDFDEIPLEYLDEMLDNFADICRLYQSLGFDICNIYMSNDNTLLAKSLSPVLHTRTDNYGGKTLRERAALTMELFRRIRKDVYKRQPTLVWQVYPS